MRATETTIQPLETPSPDAFGVVEETREKERGRFGGERERGLIL